MHTFTPARFLFLILFVIQAPITRPASQSVSRKKVQESSPFSSRVGPTFFPSPHPTPYVFPFHRQSGQPRLLPRHVAKRSRPGYSLSHETIGQEAVAANRWDPLVDLRWWTGCSRSRWRELLPIPSFWRDLTQTPIKQYYLSSEDRHGASLGGGVAAPGVTLVGPKRRVVKADEIAKHKTVEKGLWVAIDGRVVDVSRYLEENQHVSVFVPLKDGGRREADGGLV